MAFRFKQFSVEDERSSMKVGTDAVLLGAWAGIKPAGTILDIGTGSGIIALMMAQRFPGASIMGIDIHRGSVLQSKENFTASPWADRLSVSEISLQGYIKTERNRYELLVSNPPFFINSLLPPSASRKVARHTVSLSYGELIRYSKLLLHPSGCISFIMPYENKMLFHDLMKKNGMYLQRELDVIPVRGKEANRFLSEWGSGQVKPQLDALTIRTDPKNYTSEYREFTKEFYVAL